MCTSIVYTAGDSYFGRNLDLEVSVGEEVVMTPRNFAFNFKKVPAQTNHYAIMGIGPVIDGYPLYCDAANEKGLGMAGLNFNGPCHFFDEIEGKNNVTPFEFIPYILGQCATVAEAKKLLAKMSLVNISFSPKLSLSPLHWLIADKSGASIVVESTKTGLHVYDDPVGVLTNNPEFPQQMTNLSNYQNIGTGEPINTLVPGVKLNTYSRGLATNTLPGGMDSESRFVRATFAKAHAPESDDELTNVTDYFKILNAVSQPKNLDEVGPDTFEYTIYTDCFDLSKMTMYYTTYENAQINAVRFDPLKIESDRLLTFPMLRKQAINFQN